MTSIDDIMRFTTIRFGPEAPLHLIITNKASEADPAEYLVQYEGKPAVLRHSVKGKPDEWLLIPEEQHGKHIEKFGIVRLFSKGNEIRKQPINDYLKYIQSAI